MFFLWVNSVKDVALFMQGEVLSLLYYIHIKKVNKNYKMYLLTYIFSFGSLSSEVVIGYW